MFILSDVVTRSISQFFVRSTIQLADGTPVSLRPMRPTDVSAILEMYDRLSSDSIYYRYLHPYKPTVEELDRLARLDNTTGAAFVATVDVERKEKVIGLGYYQTEPEDRTAASRRFSLRICIRTKGWGARSPGKSLCAREQTESRYWML